jgi:hypothetical protein
MHNLPFMHSFYAHFAHKTEKPLGVRYIYILMLSRDAISVYSEKHTDYVNTLCSEMQRILRYVATAILKV